MLRSYFAEVVLSYFGDEEVVTDPVAVIEPIVANPDGTQMTADQLKVFNQAQVNKYLADDRRKTEAKYKAQMKTELQKQEQMYNALLANQNLTEQDRDNLRSSLEAVEQQLFTEKELLTKQKKEVETLLTGKLTVAEKRAQEWEGRFRETNIIRSLQDAVASDAFDSAQMIDILRPRSESVEITDSDGKGTGVYQVLTSLDIIEDGQQKTLKLAPSEAVKRMKTMPRHANLFKSNVISGAGANNGASDGNGGPIKVANLSQEEYRKLRKTNPAAIYGK